MEDTSGRGEMRKKNIDWLSSVDIGFLTETERDSIIDVLRRDEKLRTFEKKRVVQLKCELRDVRRRGAKIGDSTYSNHVCARCNASTGHIINKALPCPICKHKTCEKCRVNSHDMWICIVCYKESKIKAKTGEWFFDAMRAELKSMADGSTLLKQAVIQNSARSSPKTSPGSDRLLSTPEIRYTPASSSNSTRSSFGKTPDLISVGSMESISSSTESYAQSPMRLCKSGPVETGSIGSLRSLRYISRDPYFSDSDQSTTSLHGTPIKPIRTSTLPSKTKYSNSERDVNVGSTLPHYKTKSERYHHSHVSLTLEEQSIGSQKSVSDYDSMSSHSKETSHTKKKLHSAGRKLHAQKMFSQSVPSLAMPKHTEQQAEEEKTVSETYGNRLSARGHQLSMSTSNIAEKQSESAPSGKGEIKFSLEFDYKTNHLIVLIAECRNLSCVDIHKKSCDPYVKCYLLPDRSVKRKTSSKKHTTSPKYHQELKFAVSMSELSNRVLEMSVWNAATFSRNSFLGHLQVALDTWKWKSSPTPHWFPLKRKELSQSDSLQSVSYKGDLLIAASYKSPEVCEGRFGEIHVMIKQAKNLMPVLSNGTVDAFVKISVLPEKDVREKSDVISGSTNPLWNARYRLPLLHHPIQESGLQITLWHKAHGSTTSRKSRKLLLGGIRLTRKSDTGNDIMSSTDEERLIWGKICNSPGLWIDATVSLRSLL